MKKENIDTKKKNIENISKVIEEKRKIPKDIKNKINTKRFQNAAIAIIAFIYLGALNLGMINIPTENYLMDLKVFSMLLLIGSIILFEVAYKKDKGEIFLHGIEAMVAAIFTEYLIYMYSIFYNTFGSIVLSFGILCLIYYAVKVLILKKKIIKEYNKSLIDINEIVKK